MRKSVSLTKKLIAELEKHGNVFQACGKLRLATSTYYRWVRNDPEFRALANEAVEIGIKSITSFAESKLIQNVRNGNQRAIEFQLRGNDERYMSMNRKDVEQQIEKFKKENDISDEMRNLKFLATGLFKMQDEVALKRRIENLKATSAMLKKPTGGQYYSNYDEETYIGEMLASGFLQEIISEVGDDIKKISGTQKVRPVWGLRDFDKLSGSCDYCTYNNDGMVKKKYSEEEYKEMRRQEIRGWNKEHGVPEDEGIDF